MKKTFLRRIVYIALLLFLFLGCNRNTQSKHSDDINSLSYIDANNINSQLKRIIYNYIEAYPKFNNLVLDQDFILNSYQKYYEPTSLYILGPTSMLKYGEYYGDKRLFPTSFFMFHQRYIFFSSTKDRFYNQIIAKKVFIKHLELKEYRKDYDVYFWLIQILPNGKVIIVTKNINKYLGIKAL